MRVIVGHGENLAGSALDWSGDRPLTLGRSTTAAVRVADEKAGGLHLRLEVAAGIVYALDLGGPGGIAVNGKRAEKKQIDLGDTVTFGEGCWVKLLDSGVTVAVRPRSELGDESDRHDLRARAAAVTVRDIRAPGGPPPASRRAVEAPVSAPPAVDRERTTEDMKAGTKSGNVPAAPPGPGEPGLRTDVTQATARPSQPSAMLPPPPPPMIEGGDTAELPRPGAEHRPQAGEETLALPAPLIAKPIPHPPHQRWVEGYWVDDGLLPELPPPPRGIFRRTARWIFGRRRRG